MSGMMEIKAVVKVTETKEISIFLGAIVFIEDQVEDGNISKGTAYNRIIQAYKSMLEKIEKSDGE